MDDELKAAKDALVEAEAAATAAAQPAADALTQFRQVGEEAAQYGVAVGWDKSAVLTLSIAILIFGLIVLLLVVYLTVQKASSPFILQAFALPLIIISAIFLVVTGYSQQQIAPVIGLLGTIPDTCLERRQSAEQLPTHRLSAQHPSLIPLQRLRSLHKWPEAFRALVLVPPPRTAEIIGDLTSREDCTHGRAEPFRSVRQGI